MACMQATAHLLVFADLSLSIKVYLEGALIGTDGDETAAGHPRMRDDLRSNRFNNENYIPLADPYQFAVSPILDYTSKFTHVGAGLLPENQFITDSAAVFYVDTDIFNYGTTMNATDYSGLSQNTMIKPGYNALWGGDMNCDGLIKFTNPDDDHNWLFFDVLLIEDNVTGVINYNFGYGYYNICIPN